MAFACLHIRHEHVTTSVFSPSLPLIWLGCPGIESLSSTALRTVREVGLPLPQGRQTKHHIKRHAVHCRCPMGRHMEAAIQGTKGLGTHRCCQVNHVLCVLFTMLAASTAHAQDDDNIYCLQFHLDIRVSEATILAIFLETTVSRSDTRTTSTTILRVWVSSQTLPTPSASSSRHFRRPDGHCSGMSKTQGARVTRSCKRIGVPMDPRTPPTNRSHASPFGTSASRCRQAPTTYRCFASERQSNNSVKPLNGSAT